MSRKNRGRRRRRKAPAPILSNAVAGSPQDRHKLFFYLSKRFHEAAEEKLRGMTHWIWFRNGDFTGVEIHFEGRPTSFGATKRRATDRMNEDIAIGVAVHRAVMASGV